MSVTLKASDSSVLIANQKAVRLHLNVSALIRNTTIGINSIVSSLGNKIKGTLILSHVYAAMRNTMDLHRIEFAEKFTVNRNFRYLTVEKDGHKKLFLGPNMAQKFSQ